MRRSRNFGYTLIEIMIVIAIMGILAAILLPSLTHAIAQGKLSACKSNLKNLCVAIETYANDYDGQYPPMMRDLVPGYLAVLPTCPSRGGSYTRGVPASNPETYILYCRTSSHSELGLADNFPQYAPGIGLLEK